MERKSMAELKLKAYKDLWISALQIIKMQSQGRG
jgi:hypothetical protein